MIRSLSLQWWGIPEVKIGASDRRARVKPTGKRDWIKSKRMGIYLIKSLAVGERRGGASRLCVGASLLAVLSARWFDQDEIEETCRESGEKRRRAKAICQLSYIYSQQQQQHFTAVLRNEERFISIHIDMLWLYSFLHILFFPVDGLLSKRRHLLAHLFPFRLVSNEFPGHSLGVGDTNQPRVSINIQN
jgi:hypothetical protein